MCLPVPGVDDLDVILLHQGAEGGEEVVARGKHPRVLRQRHDADGGHAAGRRDEVLRGGAVISTCIHIYIYIYIYIEREREGEMYTHIRIRMCVCIYIYIHIHTCIYMRS